MHSFILILANFHFLYIQTQQVYTIYIAIKVYFLLSFHIAVATYFLLISDYLLEFAAKQYAHILKFQHPKHFSLIILPWLSRKLILSKSNPESKLPMHISESSSETLSHGKNSLLYPQIVF